jgi:uncharacterized protein YyaL (SSP411 family)
MHTNRLANEKSPYLLQHAHNPVDWYPWGAPAFEKARTEQKPIFLSIGYSTCHWCHVMERESFENDEIAEILNQNYVAIKIDREERPDIDRIYMTFVQSTTGSGGWPMSVWLTPELEPFYGGTYFPPQNRWGHPGFGSILTQIAEAWSSDREKIMESARDVVEQLKKQTTVAPLHDGAPFDAATLDSGFAVLRRTFDTRLGGFGGAPKFPRPTVYNFLLRYWHRTKNQEALDMVLLTLREMAKGGMYDQLGGGFHRYAVDDRWFVPHFEKMLYDQGQLATSYLEAYQITDDRQYANVARGIFDYLLRDMVDPAGGFYSAEDADSVITREHPDLKGEGAFYIWSWEDVAGPGREWFAYRYGMAESGNVDNDPHGEFTGKSILFQAHSVEDTARHFGVPVDDVRLAIGRIECALMKVRDTRVRPHLDDKILTAWNGLMISALAMGGAVLQESRYADAARAAAEFILSHLYDAKSGVLLRRYRAGEAAIPGFLDDYAMFVQALLDLYEAQFDPRHLELALKLTEKMRELFEDRESGAFFSSPAGDPTVILRVKEDYDGAEPSGNSVAVKNLLRLAAITAREDLRESADRALRAFGSRLKHVPIAIPQMLVACEWLLSRPKEIVIAGEDTAAMVTAVQRVFVPNKIVLRADAGSRTALEAMAPWAEPMQPVDGRAAAYVCSNYACQLPVTEAVRLVELIQ